MTEPVEDRGTPSAPVAPEVNATPMCIIGLYCMGLAFLTIGVFALFGAWGYIVLGTGMIFLSAFIVYLLVTPAITPKVWNI